MKTLVRSVVGVVMTALVVIPMQLFAQAADTLDVAALPIGNINNVIAGDTLAGGVRAHPNRVYRLNRGSVYQVTAAMKINGNLTIVASSGTNRPPVLAPAILSDNSSPDHFFDFIGKAAKVNLNNVYLLGVRADGNTLGWSAGMRIYGDSTYLRLRGVIFDAFSEAGIRVYAHWTKSDVQDSHFRNLQHSTSWFGGQPFMTDAPNAQDTCKFVNNTFFACNAYLWSIRGYDRFSLFEHNTIAYSTVNPFLIRQASNLHIKNNLFYSAHAMGGNPDHVVNGWFLNYPDTVSSSIIRIRARDSVSAWSKLWKATITGPESYVDAAHGVTADMLSPSKRVFELRNNAYVFPQKLVDFYKAYNDTVQTADSISAPSGRVRAVRKLILAKWISEYAQYTIDNFLKGVATVNVANNVNADPQFTSAGVVNHVDKQIEYVKKIATGTLDVPWFYNPNNALYPPAWPLPENLAYSNATLQKAGTDGFPVGDLNWFPTDKAKWLTTGVEDEQTGIVPADFKLYDAYPNPFNPETNIKIDVANASTVKLAIYNILGQEVKVLINDRLNPGTHTAKWNGTDHSGAHVPSGVYFYKVEGGSFTATKKLMLLK